MARVSVNLALQGGGAHGAFTWGVLDRLLEDDGVEIASISGTSAGAMNGAALKAGMVKGGRAGARAALRDLWERISGVGDLSAVGWFRPFLPSMSAAVQMSEALMPVSPSDLASRMFSPYDWGPMWRNPLSPVVRALDMEAVCSSEGPKLFVAATNVHTGKVRVCSGEDVSPEALLASACLPTAFKAVEIEGEPYWDGGYSANPALFPLYDEDLPDDVVIVSINPLLREETPKTTPEILNRMNEISFNASLLRDLRAISFVKRLIAEGSVTRGAMKEMLVHLIAEDELMRGLSVRTKLAPTPVLLHDLFEAGRGAADGFLSAHREDIGKRDTVDLEAMFS